MFDYVVIITMGLVLVISNGDYCMNDTQNICTLQYSRSIYYLFRLFSYPILFLIFRSYYRIHAPKRTNVSVIEVDRIKSFVKKLEATDAIVSTSTENECVICLINYIEGDVIRELDACKHFYHKDCIDKWLVQKANCPMCRTAIEVV